MSVMHFGNEKFQRLDKHLGQMDGREFAHAFGYPQGWQNGDVMKSHITAFLQDCQRANTATWDRQYRDKTVLTTFAPKCVKIYANDCALLKSLQGLRYNLIDNDGRESSLNNCYDKLDKIIDFIKSKIIDTMPEYRNADTWSE